MKRLFTVILLFLSWSHPTYGQTAGVPAPRSFKLCASCHVPSTEDCFRVAPSLDGVVGRDIASIPDFDYSDALLAEEGVWTVEKLDTFLQRPNHALPGTHMYFRGIYNKEARLQLINWLAGHGQTDTLLGNAATTTQYAQEYTQGREIFDHCTVCHSYSQGAPAKIGPNLWGIVGRKIASFPNFNYSENLLRREGTWTEEKLLTFFEQRKAFKKGTHKAFEMLHTREDRKRLIRFLQTLSEKPIKPSDIAQEEPRKLKGN